MKNNSLYFLLSFCIFCSCTSEPKKPIIWNYDTTDCACKPKLGQQFGTIYNLKVKVIDGEDLRMKAYWGVYLMKILEVEGVQINDTILMTFKDRTDEFPEGSYELREHLKGDINSRIEPEEELEFEKDYIGKTFDIVAYESGTFEGIPENYFDYQPVMTARGFYFINYLMVISSPTFDKDKDALNLPDDLSK